MEWIKTIHKLPTCEVGEQVDVIMWSPGWATWIKGLFTFWPDKPEWGQYNNYTDRFEDMCDPYPEYWCTVILPEPFKLELWKYNMETQYIRIDEDGSKFYYQDREMNSYHREGGPAIEWADGEKMWLQNNRLHREDGPAIEDADGNKEWFIEGLFHRTDGPAIELANGYKSWWLNGEIYREDGPAIEWADGSKTWYLHGKVVTEEEYSAYNRTKGNNL